MDQRHRRMVLLFYALWGSSKFMLCGVHTKLGNLSKALFNLGLCLFSSYNCWSQSLFRTLAFRLAQKLIFSGWVYALGSRALSQQRSECRLFQHPLTLETVATSLFLHLWQVVYIDDILVTQLGYSERPNWSSHIAESCQRLIDNTTSADDPQKEIWMLELFLPPHRSTF